AGGIEHMSSDDSSGIAARHIKDEARLPVFQEPSRPTGTFRHKQLAWADRQFERPIGTQVVADVLIRRRVVHVAVQRRGPVLRHESQSPGKNVCALDSQSGRWAHRDLQLARMVVRFAEAADVVGVQKLRVRYDVVFGKTTQRLWDGWTNRGQTRCEAVAAV